MFKIRKSQHTTVSKGFLGKNCLDLIQPETESNERPVIVQTEWSDANHDYQRTRRPGQEF